MKINRKIKIITILAIITLMLVAIGISANSINNRKSKCQQNDWCPNTEECPQPYCNYKENSIRNCQPRLGCCWST
jgi:hypothetical protein